MKLITQSQFPRLFLCLILTSGLFLGNVCAENSESQNSSQSTQAKVVSKKPQVHILTTPVTAQHIAKIDAIIDAIDPMQSHTQVTIGGSTARSFLDNALFETPIHLRDFDVQVLNQTPESFISKLKNTLPVGTRVQYNDDHPKQIQIYVDELQMDISAYSSWEQLNSRGIFDIDTIRVDISEGLSKTLQQISTIPFQTLKETQLVIDPLNGYPSYLSGYFQLRNDIHDMDYSSMVLRAIVNAFKMNLIMLPEQLTKDFASYRAVAPKGKLKSIVKKTLRILGNARSAEGIQWAAQYNVFEDTLPKFSATLKNLPIERLQVLFSQSNAPKDRLRALTQFASSDETNAILKMMKKINL